MCCFCKVHHALKTAGYAKASQPVPARSTGPPPRGSPTPPRPNRWQSPRPGNWPTSWNAMKSATSTNNSRTLGVSTKPRIRPHRRPPTTESPRTSRHHPSDPTVLTRPSDAVKALVHIRESGQTLASPHRAPALDDFRGGGSQLAFLTDHPDLMQAIPQAGQWFAAPVRERNRACGRTPGRVELSSRTHSSAGLLPIAASSNCRPSPVPWACAST